jgi:hypothetical protein
MSRTAPFAPDNPTPEQLLDMALQHAWRERRHWPPALGIARAAGTVSWPQILPN